MKLERLDELKKVTKKQLIVNQTLNNLQDSKYYSIFELKTALALTILVLYGNTELHEKMFADDTNMVDFIDENYNLVEAVEETSEYKEIFDELVRLAGLKADYNRTFISQIEAFIKNILNDDNLKDILERPEIKELLEKIANKEEIEPEK